MKHAQIHIGAETSEILLDGEPARGVTGIEFSYPKVGDRPRLTLHLAVFPVEIDAGVTLHVSDNARQTLIDFGWQPPVDEITDAD